MSEATYHCIGFYDVFPGFQNKSEQPYATTEVYVVYDQWRIQGGQGGHAPPPIKN